MVPFLIDIVMMLTFLMAGQPATAFFSMVGEKLWYGIPAGLAAHNLVGLTGGIVFAVLVLTVANLCVDSRRKGLLLGIGAGVLTIPLGCIPLAIWIGQPMMEVIAFSILPHLVWGAALGSMVGYEPLLRPTCLAARLGQEYPQKPPQDIVELVSYDHVVLDPGPVLAGRG